MNDCYGSVAVVPCNPTNFMTWMSATGQGLTFKSEAWPYQQLDMLFFNELNSNVLGYWIHRGAKLIVYGYVSSITTITDCYVSTC